MIFEKPFGEDLESAQALAAQLSAELAEDEIYRVDHYLGKAGVQAITHFRQAQVGGLCTGYCLCVFVCLCV